MSEFNVSIEEIMKSTFIKYKGCLIEVRFGSKLFDSKLFIWNRCHCHTLADIKRHIDLSLEDLQASIADAKEREGWLENQLDRQDYYNSQP